MHSPNIMHFLHIIRSGMCKFCTYDLMVDVVYFATTTNSLHVNNLAVVAFFATTTILPNIITCAFFSHVS